MSKERFTYPSTIKSVNHEKMTLSILEGAIYKINILERAEVNLDDVKYIQKVGLELTENKEHYVLFIAPKFGSISNDARKYSATPEASTNVICRAIVAPNLGMRIIANFFIQYNKPAVEHKIFLKVEDALEWLSLKSNQSLGQIVAETHA